MRPRRASPNGTSEYSSADSAHDHESRARSIARNRFQKGSFLASSRRRFSSAALRASARWSSSSRRRSSSLSPSDRSLLSVGSFGWFVFFHDVELAIGKEAR